jgi:hypothetical protein
MPSPNREAKEFRRSFEIQPLAFRIEKHLARFGIRQIPFLWSSSTAF